MDIDSEAGRREDNFSFSYSSKWLRSELLFVPNFFLLGFSLSQAASFISMPNAIKKQVNFFYYVTYDLDCAFGVPLKLFQVV